MKWIKKLFGKREDSSEETGLKEINFEDLPAWLDARSQKISSRVEKDMSGLLSEFEASLSELEESNSKLAEARVEGDFDIRAVKRAKSNRENVTKQVTLLIDKIRVQENRDFRALENFYGAATQSLESCLEHMNRSFRYTRVVFPEESKEVSESLASLGGVFKALREVILVNKKEMDYLETARSDIKEINELSASIADEELEMESRIRRVQTLRTEASEAGKALEDFRKGAAWQSLQNLQAEFSAAREKLRKAEAGLSSLILPLSGHLSRIKKLHESSRYTLKPEVKNQLDICLENPVKVDPSFFPELQKILEDNALDMQAQKKEKALLQVKTAISAFPERKKEYLEALQEFEAKKAEIESSDTGKLAELEHKEAELLSRAHLLEEDVEDSEKKLAALKEEFEHRKEKLLTDINLIDSNVKINFQ
ncbi:cell surface protein [Methanosarcina sp. MSH10X1]|uniref:cell surface protein n=1 Tax=Methanosarcina sp. MSH10X1 TaxID=2507075 RepID=UPI000FFBC490|nr:cell surface protein [Methanosarcina sp. MSH10X1]RXA20220.1 cell surface protein [Methanosarcina sp. MSH10X1]